MKRRDVDRFEKIQMQLDGAYNEMTALSKKKSDDAVNKFKLSFVNTLIKEANDILGGKYRPFNNFENFDEDNIPTNSDVVMLLSQYLNCLEKLRCDNITNYGGAWYWMIDSKRSDLRAALPMKLKQK